MQNNIWIYIAIMALVTFAVRAIPLTFIRREIKNTTIRSFLFYVPYVTLAVMTFPAIMDSTATHWSGLIALALGIVLAWCRANLFTVAVSACAVVFVFELIIK